MVRGKRRKRKVIKKRIHPTAKKIEKIQGVKKAMAERLRRAGYGSLEKLAQTQVSKLIKEAGLKKNLAERLISSAKDIYKGSSMKHPAEEKTTIAKGGKTLKERLLQEAIKDEGFRKRVIYYVIDNLF